MARVKLVLAENRVIVVQNVVLEERRNKLASASSPGSTQASVALRVWRGIGAGAPLPNSEKQWDPFSSTEPKRAPDAHM